MNNKESFSLVGRNTCERTLQKYPDYKVFWRSGYAFRGAIETFDDKAPREEYVWQYGGRMLLTFADRMERRYHWSAAIDIEINHDAKEIHFNGFSSNDLY